MTKASKNFFNITTASLFPLRDTPPGVEDDKDSGIERKWYNMSYDVTTSTEIYRMAFIWCAKDTGDSGNVGIESFYILKANDDPNYPQYSYGGDGAWTPGINIGKTHEVL